jgi:hypothetical protein
VAVVANVLDATLDVSDRVAGSAPIEALALHARSELHVRTPQWRGARYVVLRGPRNRVVSAESVPTVQRGVSAIVVPVLIDVVDATAIDLRHEALRVIDLNVRAEIALNGDLVVVTEGIVQVGNDLTTDEIARAVRGALVTRMVQRAKEGMLVLKRLVVSVQTALVVGRASPWMAAQSDAMIVSVDAAVPIVRVVARIVEGSLGIDLRGFRDQT